jgi:GNAT superfamily N-acetyltransferase
MRVDVGIATAGDKRPMAVALARAFQDDPLLAFAMANPLRRARALLRIMATELYDAAHHGEIWVAHREGVLSGAAVWYRPGAYKKGTFRSTTKMARLLPNAAATGTRSIVMARLYRRIEAAHPSDEHWYLHILGVDPLCQRSGVGRAVIEPVLERCDSEGLPAYLVTQKPENVPWYERSGFKVRDEIRVGGTPPVWSLGRMPGPG